MADEAEVLAEGQACFRHKFSGLYKTFSPGDKTFTVLDWIRIHMGPCECEGKTADVCQEPGDDN